MSEEIKLLPCPACGGKAEIHGKARYESFYIECCDCGTRGPTAHSDFGNEEKVKNIVAYNWNIMPREQHWSKKKPITGWYWLRKTGWYWLEKEEQSAEIVFVNADGYIKAKSANSSLKREMYVLNDPMFDNAEWAGPIPLPKEE